MRPFVVLTVNLVVFNVGVLLSDFTGGCLIAAMVVADCMAVIAEGRAWAREDADDEVWDDECRGGAMPRDGQLFPPSRATGATLGDRAIVARERARSVTDAPRPFDREKAL